MTKKKKKQVGTVGYTAPACECLVVNVMTNDAKEVEAERKVRGELWVPRCIQEAANLFFWRISILADTGSALVMETRFLGTSPLASPAGALLVWVS